MAEKKLFWHQKIRDEISYANTEEVINQLYHDLEEAHSSKPKPEGPTRFLDEADELSILHRLRALSSTSTVTQDELQELAAHAGTMFAFYHTRAVMTADKLQYERDGQMAKLCETFMKAAQEVSLETDATQETSLESDPVQKARLEIETQAHHTIAPTLKKIITEDIAHREKLSKILWAIDESIKQLDETLADSKRYSVNKNTTTALRSLLDSTAESTHPSLTSLKNDIEKIMEHAVLAEKDIAPILKNVQTFAETQLERAEKQCKGNPGLINILKKIKRVISDAIKNLLGRDITKQSSVKGIKSIRDTLQGASLFKVEGDGEKHRKPVTKSARRSQRG